MSFEELRFEAIGLELAALRWRTAAEPTVIALHGWLDNAGSFAHLAPLLHADVIAIDFPGHGVSDHLKAEQSYSLATYVDYIATVIESLNIDRYHMLGHSLGGAVALLLAQRHSPHMASLLLLDSLGPVSQETLAPTTRVGRVIQRIMAQAHRPATAYPTFAAARESRQRSGNLSAAAAQPLAARGVQQVAEDDYRWHFDRRLLERSQQLHTEAEVLTLLNRLTIPTLLCEPDAGILAAQTFAAQRRRQISNLTVATFQGHHHWHLETPQPLAETLSSFMEQHL